MEPTDIEPTRGRGRAPHYHSEVIGKTTSRELLHADATGLPRLLIAMEGKLAAFRERVPTFAELTTLLNDPAAFLAAKLPTPTVARAMLKRLLDALDPQTGWIHDTSQGGSPGSIRLSLNEAESRLRDIEAEVAATHAAFTAAARRRAA